MTRRLILAGVFGTIAVLALAAPSQAAPKRVVTLEYDSLENLLSLGIKPVGAADLRGYRQRGASLIRRP